MVTHPVFPSFLQQTRVEAVSLPCVPGPGSRHQREREPHDSDAGPAWRLLWLPLRDGQDDIAGCPMCFSQTSSAVGT